MYEIKNKKGETVSAARNYTFAASLKSVLEKETGKEYQIELSVKSEPIKKYRLVLLVEQPKTITVKAAGLSTVSDAIRPLVREKFGQARTRIDWNATKALNTPLTEADKEYLAEIE